MGRLDMAEESGTARVLPLTHPLSEEFEQALEKVATGESAFSE